MEETAREAGGVVTFPDYALCEHGYGMGNCWVDGCIHSCTDFEPQDSLLPYFSPDDVEEKW